MQKGDFFLPGPFFFSFFHFDEFDRQEIFLNCALMYTKRNYYLTILLSVS